MQINKATVIKFLFVVVLFLYITSAVMFNNGKMIILDSLNLAFHEFGHLFFYLFGDTIQFLGGTIFQLLVPFAITIYFVFHRKLYSSSVTLFWFGQNMFGISDYIKDARARVLPLIGGGIHDWNYLLREFGLLQYDMVIGNTVYWIGWVIIIIAAITGLYFAIMNEQ
jgi:hypothetical protein